MGDGAAFAMISCGIEQRGQAHLPLFAGCCYHEGWKVRLRCSKAPHKSRNEDVSSCVGGRILQGPSISEATIASRRCRKA